MRGKIANHFRSSVTFRMENAQDVRDMVDQYGDREIELTVSLPRKKRSLSANAYAWVLIGKLAAELGQTKTLIYRSAIRDIGDNYDIVYVQTRAIEAFRAGWDHRKDESGWFTEILDQDDDGAQIICYYGSSVYDTRQMAALIDYLVQEAKAYGIETMTPAEQADLMQKWEERYGR